MDETKRLSMRRKHAKRPHLCKFCGYIALGNGGYASHMRKEYFSRMPDMKNVKWVTVADLRQEWRRRNPTTGAVDLGDSSALKVGQRPEVLSAGQGESQLAPNH